jgi:hypothetical protein
MVYVNKNTVLLQVSCPCCNEILTANTTCEDEEVYKNSNLNHFLEHTVGVIDHYCFRGFVKCENCGKITVCCLAVSAHC